MKLLNVHVINEMQTIYKFNLINIFKEALI